MEPNEIQAEALEVVVRRIDPNSRLRRSWPLTGGVSAQVIALEVQRADGEIDKFVIRRHGEGDLKRNPHLAVDEFRLLQILHRAGVAAPKPIYLDPQGEFLGTPLLVMEFIEGEPETDPRDVESFLRQMAVHLAAVHRVDIARWDLSFLPCLGSGWGSPPAILDESLAEGEIRAALKSRWPLAHMNGAVLLHGDYWPGNLLWREDQLVGVVDWEDAAVGDPLADVANSRLELLWALGSDAMHRFTLHYRASMAALNFSNLAYWDLCAALRPASKLSTWGLDAEVEVSMRSAHRRFIEQALAALAL